MPGIILSVILMVAIALGIAWPLIQRRRQQIEPEGTETAAPVVPVPVPEKRRLEQLCPHCSIMNAASRTTCWECGSALPLDNFSGLLGGADKQETIRELTQGGLLLLGMILIMLVSNWLPTPGKITVIVGTLALISFRFYKHISGD